jgi:predicted RNA binding protein YcfA (HicA-like mRNA interferase family)
VNQGPDSDWQEAQGADKFQRVPRKIGELHSDLQRAGFYLAPGGKGSHRKFRHPEFLGSVISVDTMETMRGIIRKKRFVTQSAGR